ncbi:MAG TPA: hypothetical protein VNA68_02365 [Candidatus Dormibacteraeota bacterium]|nr:hypothetical protein [Candidatus Dormibacteraeota bacterium]
MSEINRPEGDPSFKAGENDMANLDHGSEEPEKIKPLSQFEKAQREVEAVLRARESDYGDIYTTGGENDISALGARLDLNLEILRQHAETEQQHAALRRIESRLS